MSGELKGAVAHSVLHWETAPCICAFSVLGYATVAFILLIIKNFGATNAEVVKSMRKVGGRALRWPVCVLGPLMLYVATSSALFAKRADVVAKRHKRSR